LEKIIYINGRFLTQPITGVQRYGHEIVRAFDELIEADALEFLQFKFEVLTPKRKNLHHLPLKHIHIRKVGYLSGHFWEQLELPFYARKGLLFCPGNTAPVLRLLLKNPVVVTVHSLSVQYFPGAYSFKFKLLYKIILPLIFHLADSIITVSNSEQNSIIHSNPKIENKLSCVQNGGFSKIHLEKAIAAKKSAKSRNKTVLLYIGSLSKAKNISGVIEAARILEKKTSFVLKIAGSTGRVFKKTGIELSEKLLDRIEFLGYINDVEELINLYQEATCLVFPSFYEASPLPPIEAMNCGCPVIASAIPSLRERCGDAALYCNPNAPSDIADKILKLTQDKELRREFIEKGYERANQFTWEECAKETMRILATQIQKNTIAKRGTA
jgi:glycosyltransferase involved in cell wall biosynthesis